jgi:hypothetical protein
MLTNAHKCFFGTNAKGTKMKPLIDTLADYFINNFEEAKHALIIAASEDELYEIDYIEDEIIAAV